MATSLLLEGLEQGATYEFQVITNGDGITYDSSDASSTVQWSTKTQLATPVVTTTKTTSSITPSWSAITGATSYTVEYKLSTAETWTTTTTPSTSKTIDSLTSGATYDIRVKATSTDTSYVDSEYSTVASVVVSSQLDTPAPTYSSTVNSISASWSAITNATSYTVYYKKSSASSYTSETVGANTTWTKSSLTSGDTYSVYVQAIGSGNYADSANSTATDVTVKTQLPNPDAPTLTNRTTSSLTFTWNAIAHADGYKVYATKGTKHLYFDTATNSITIPDLEEGTTVTVFVAALGSGAYVSSEGGDPSVGTTQITLATPTGLTASNVLSTTATLSWNAVTNATGYLLTISDANGAITGYDGKAVTGTTESLTGLTETHEYTVSLVATTTSDDYVNSAATTLVFTTDTKLGAPDAPTLSATIESVTATWGAVSAADSYTLAYKASTDSDFTEITGITATTYTVSNLAQGVAYTFKVRAITTNDAYENGDYSTTATATTLIKLASPDGLAVSNITTTTSTLSWNSVTNASGYTVKYRKKGTTTWTSVSVEG